MNKITRLCFILSLIQSIQNFDILKMLKESECELHMNSFYGPAKNWTCGLIESESRLNSISCICSFKYGCFDIEEFVLETELVDINEYMRKDFFLQTNIYTQECENGLRELTGAYDWKCFLKYDRFHLDEYYCSCKRIKECIIDKVLSLEI